MAMPHDPAAGVESPPGAAGSTTGSSVSCCHRRSRAARSRWGQDRDTVRESDSPFRLRVNFGGVRPEDARLYALYIV